MPKCWRSARRPASSSSERLDAADLYVTLEPCAMCAGAISFAAHPQAVFRRGRRERRRGGQRRALFRVTHLPSCAGNLSRHRRGQIVRAAEGFLSRPALDELRLIKATEPDRARCRRPSCVASLLRRRSFLYSSSPSSSAAAVAAGTRYSSGGSLSILRTVGLPCCDSASLRLNSSACFLESTPAAMPESDRLAEPTALRAGRTAPH